MAQPDLVEEFFPIVDPVEKKNVVVQYDFFESSSMALLKAEIKDLKDRQDKARKGWFARHNAMVKMFIELKIENDTTKEMFIELKKRFEELKEKLNVFIA